ncbi:MAG: hypothetical protein ABIZ80_02740 [Bryobacteraceae bacterium]
MQSILAVILAVLLAGSSLGARPKDGDPRRQAMNIRAGSPVEVLMADDARITGRLGAISGAAFEIQTVRQSRTETRKIGFGQVKSIRKTSGTAPGMRATKIVLITGIVVGLGLVTVGIVCAIACGG